jgi:hypothetical protein
MGKLMGSLRALQLADGGCANRHMQFLTHYHYRFCPFCGKELKITLVCEHCGHNFISERAYTAHLSELKLIIQNPCPSDTRGKGHGNRHPIRHLKNRGTMYCDQCHIEYPVKGKAKPIDLLPHGAYK